MAVKANTNVIEKSDRRTYFQIERQIKFQPHKKYCKILRTQFGKKISSTLSSTFQYTSCFIVKCL